MSLKDCFARAYQQGFLTADEFDQLSKRYDQIAKETLDTAEARARMQKEIEAEAAHRERAALLTHIGNERLWGDLTGFRTNSGLRDVTLGFLAAHENFARDGTFMDDAESIRYEIINRSIQKIQVVYHGLQRESFGNVISGAMSANARRLGLKKQQMRMENVLDELSGKSTGDSSAANMASAIREMLEDLRIEFNAAGGSIGKLENYDIPHAHNALAMLDAGPREWIKHLMGDNGLDRERMIHPLTGKKMSTAELEKSLLYVYEQATTDGHSNKDVTSKPPGKGALYKQHADHRFLHFKDTKAYMAYAKRFGNPDLLAILQSHISVMARDISHMRRFSPNANATRELMKNRIRDAAKMQRPIDVLILDAEEKIRELQAEAATLGETVPPDLDGRLRAAEADLANAAGSGNADAIRAGQERLGQILKEIIGDGSGRRVEIAAEITKLFEEMRQPINAIEGQKRVIDYVNKKLARADEMWEGMRGHQPRDMHLAAKLASARNFISGSSLGFAVASSLADVAYGQDARMRLGESFAKANFGKLIVGNLKEMLTRGGREDAVDSYLGLDAAMGIVRRQASEVKGWDHQFWTGIFAKNTLTWGLLLPWTQAGKHEFGRWMHKYMGSVADKSFADLPIWTQRALRSNGFEAAEWDFIRQALLPDGRLRPNEILDLPDRGQELGRRYIRMVHKEMRYAIPEATVASRTLITGVAPSGSLVGELVRSGGQFKGFSIAFTMLQAAQIARDIQQRHGWSALGFGVSMVVTMTLLGSISMALKDIAKGNDPQKWLDEKTYLNGKHWGAAFLQAGGIGIYGDLLFSETNRFDQGLPEMLAGPLIGRVSDAAKIGAEINASLQGKNTKYGAWAVQQIRRNTPYANLVWFSLALNRGVMDELQRMADPTASAAFARAVSKKQRDKGQGYYWPPGSPMPRRAPNLNVLQSR